MKKIAIYGGSFDPPHYGHSFAIWALLYSKKFDEIWVVPSSDRVDKPNAVNGEHRLNMLSLLLNDFDKDKVLIKDFQIKDKNCPKTTYKLLTYLANKYSEYSFSVALGAELISELSLWEDYNKLILELEFVVIPRLGIEANLDFIKKKKVLKLPKELDFNISSSVIRELIKDESELLGVMPLDIINYIYENRLY